MDEFKNHFRLERGTFESLVTVIVQTGYLPVASSSRRPIIHPAKQVLVAIWMLANPECHRSVADRFNITMSSVHRCLHRICEALVSVRKEFIRWPQDAKANEIEQQFEGIKGFPRVLGAIDGTHIRIRTPREDYEEFLADVNRLDIAGGNINNDIAGDNINQDNQLAAVKRDVLRDYLSL
ncbi:putative nuclease HARBI1 [Dendronephthya gigantea]|uniref:putative nuclease HARBI1 n=1 Tax=Dendronephthya gigantea TaxID=151771 RepID=UPI001069F629|nr:putative nuclease HARBI1 [Dendronephthya gigantea]